VSALSVHRRYGSAGDVLRGETAGGH
jgi:hypothetical protein